MSEKSKKPTGLKITRSGKKYVCEWTIGDDNYGDGQNFQYCFDYKGSKDKWLNHKCGTKTTSITIPLDYAKAFPKKGKQEVLLFKFRVQGNRNKKKKDKWTMSDWSTKSFDIKEPLTPTVSKERQSEEFSCKFSWASRGSDTDARPYTDAHWETILVKNSPTKAKDVAGKFKSSQTGWQQSGSDNAAHYSANLTGSKTINEDTVTLASGSWTRWFRVRTRGPGGQSDWVYSSHTYAMPKQAIVDGMSISYEKNGDGTQTVYVEWTADTAGGKRPIGQTMVQYAIAVPGPNLAVPSGLSPVDTIPQKDTGGKDAKRFVIPASSPIGKDQALFIRVNTIYDGKTNEGEWIRVLGCPTVLNDPAFSQAPETDNTTFRANVYGTNNCAIQGSWILVWYKTAKTPEPQVVGIIEPGQTYTIVQCPNWTNEGAKQFGLQARVGLYAKFNTFTIKLSNQFAASEGIIWQGGGVPEAPQNVSCSVTNLPEGTVQVSWDWTWNEANAVELSWADHSDAWESTNGPSTYTVDSIKPSKWFISGLETGKDWYVRVRLIKITGDIASYGAYSDTKSVTLKTAPETATEGSAALTILPDTITRKGTAVATWAYSSEDGTSQRSAEICEATIANDGTISYGSVIATIVGTSQRYVIDPTQISGWGSGTGSETHHLCVRVTSTNGLSSNNWSDPVALTIAEKPTVSITNIGPTMQYVDEAYHGGTYSGPAVYFDADQDTEIASALINIDPLIEGTGTPTPSNIRHISGFNQITLTKRDIYDNTEVESVTFPEHSYVPVFSGQFDMATGKLRIDKVLLTLSGTEEWVKYGDFMCLDIPGTYYATNDVDDLSDRYSYGDGLSNGFYLGDSANNLVGYGVVGTMTVE